MFLACLREEGVLFILNVLIVDIKVEVIRVLAASRAHIRDNSCFGEREEVLHSAGERCLLREREQLSERKGDLEKSRPIIWHFPSHCRLRTRDLHLVPAEVLHGIPRVRFQTRKRFRNVRIRHVDNIRTVHHLRFVTRHDIRVLDIPYRSCHLRLDLCQRYRCHRGIYTCKSKQ